jgi:hypothetical protein
MTEKQKPKSKPKTKKKKTPVNSAVDNVYASIMTGNYQPSPDRLATAQALMTLRGIEIKKTEELEVLLWAAYRGCREKIIKTLLGTVLANNLRLIDSQLLLEMLRNEVAMISAWEYEHLDEADNIIAPLQSKPEAMKQSKTLELFKALGTTEADPEEDV